MSVRVMTSVWEIELPDSEKIVLLALADCANDEGYCWPSMATLTKKCSKSERTIQGAVKSLIANGHLTQKITPGKGASYTVHPRRDCTPAETAPPQQLRDTPAALGGTPPQPLRSNRKEPSLNRHDAKASKRTTAPVFDFESPDGVDPIDWEALKANRKQKRAPLTEGAHRQIIKKLENWKRQGWPPGPIVAAAAECGWTSVFETDEIKSGKHAKPSQNQPSEYANPFARVVAARQSERASAFDG